ncbi:response regulator transcription factor [Pantoea agglomerans]|uniref:response regulator transcription factor n=1 Tax=Enterobacter agglomerans TaxID=549 RepID=UPI00301B9BD2
MRINVAFIYAVSEGSYCFIINYKNGVFCSESLHEIDAKKFAEMILSPDYLSEIVQDCYSCLTKREKKLLDFFVRGFSNREIAKLFYRSEKTIATHKHNILRKLKLRKIPLLPIVQS